MRLAVCDDESSQRLILIDAISKHGTLGDDVSVDEFPDGSSLVGSHRKLPYDIIFLDIQMPVMDGLKAAQCIRREDRSAIIVFITNYQQYVLQTFKIEAFDYLLKPIASNQVCEVLERALRKHQSLHCKAKFNNKGDAIVLDVNDIAFIESYGRRITLGTRERKFECSGNLNEFEKQLKPYGFCRCHQGFLVNMSFIEGIDGTSFLVSNGRHVPVSVRRRQECLKAYNQYLATHRV